MIEEDQEPYEFIGQQVKGILAFAIVVMSLWMIVASVVFK